MQIVNLGSQGSQILEFVDDKFVNPEILGWQICEPHVGIVVRSAHHLKSSQICHQVGRIFNINLLIESAKYFMKIKQSLTQISLAVP